MDSEDTNTSSTSDIKSRDPKIERNYLQGLPQKITGPVWLMDLEQKI